ncbi:hypothetical protein AwWohl_13990 [Gammaproteobacteria bacterium]|nr:hypothetical protein AwWohl_13990 [Gammaproteobacteria bacterium]
MIRYLWIIIFIANSVIAEQTQIEILPKTTKSNALYNYQIFCQGCHRPDGSGILGSVPALKSFMGYLTWSPKGRQYLMSSPGLSAPNLSEQDRADLLNWILLEFSEQSIPKDFQFFTHSEVAKNGDKVMLDTNQERQNIIKQIYHKLPDEIYKSRAFVDWYEITY